MPAALNLNSVTFVCYSIKNSSDGRCEIEFTPGEKSTIAWGAPGGGQGIMASGFQTEMSGFQVGATYQFAITQV